MITVSPRAEQNALDAVRDALSATLGDMLVTAQLDTLAPELLTELRSRLGGYLIDPVLVGLTEASYDEKPAREIYLDTVDPLADNMITQMLDGTEWVTLD